STLIGINVDDQINYKYGCCFEENESRAHVYQASRIGSNTFTKAESMGIHLSQMMLQHKIARSAYRDIVRFVNTVISDHDKIMLGDKNKQTGAEIGYREVADDLVKAKSSVHGYEYDVCPNGCRLYGLDDEEDQCIDCDKNPFKTSTELIKVPNASMKFVAKNSCQSLLMLNTKLTSIGDLLSNKLADPHTRNLLNYRANRESSNMQMSDIFDGQMYKDLVRRGMFSNADDIAIGLYTDRFVNRKKGKNSFTIIHVAIFNLGLSIR
ncbi:hypothetical protein INT47_001333, partial [Mucor saturninus]